MTLGFMNSSFSVSDLGVPGQFMMIQCSKNTIAGYLWIMQAKKTASTASPCLWVNNFYMVFASQQADGAQTLRDLLLVCYSSGE